MIGDSCDFARKVNFAKGILLAETDFDQRTKIGKGKVIGYESWYGI